MQRDENFSAARIVEIKTIRPVPRDEFLTTQRHPSALKIVNVFLT